MPVANSSKTNPVKLYKPQLYGTRPSSSQSGSACIIGGGTSLQECSFCGRTLTRLLHFPRPSTGDALQVHACNNLACWHRLFPIEGDTETKFCVGGRGVVQAKIVEIVDDETTTTTSTKAQPTEDWTETLNGTNSKNDNEWDTPTTNVGTTSSLEAQLAAMERKEHDTARVASPTPQRKNKADNTTNCNNDDTSMGYILHTVPEPLAVNPVSRKNPNHDNDKIQAMLEKYLGEEEDADLVAMLQNTVSGTNVAGVGVCVEEEEEDEEMLSADQLTFLAYAERIQRVPQQVVRSGGSPLWSVCTDSLADMISPCPTCGEEREVVADQDDGYSTTTCIQLLPSLLQVLKLDATAPVSESIESDSKGMDWGTIVILECLTGSCAPLVIVQRSSEQQRIEELQGEKREQFMLPPARIADGTQFSDDEEEDDE